MTRPFVRQREFLIITWAVACLAAAAPCWGQSRDRVANYPEKPIRILSAGAVGSANDILARLIGPKMTEAWGQSVIVDNRVGAGGAISAQIAAKSIPDGYTLFLGFSGNLAALPALRANLGYDPLQDFVPVTVIASLPALFVVHPSLPVTSVNEFIAYAKAHPGTLNYASAGVGSIGHVAAELFKSMTKVSMTHVPYKSSAQMVSDVIGGQPPLTFHSASVVLPFVRAGRLVSLGVTSAKRMGAAPDIPTIAQAGVPGYEAELWFGMLVPKATPRQIVEKLNHEIVRIIRSDEIQKTLVAQGYGVVGNTESEFKTYLDTEIKRYAKIISDAGISKE